MKFEFIYGGSFDPLHKGHVNLVKEVITNVKKMTASLSSIHLNTIGFRFLPCATPALKKKTLSSFVERSEKLKDVFTNYFIEQKIDMLVDEREGNRETKNKSYTIDSLKELENENILVTRFFIVGADNFNNLSNWKNYQELSSYCNLLVINRPNESLENWIKLSKEYSFEAQTDIRQLLSIKKNKVGYCYYMEIPEVNISSTELRERIYAKQSVDDWLI